jgi:hypothetical protein
LWIWMYKNIFTTLQLFNSWSSQKAITEKKILKLQFQTLTNKKAQNKLP